MPLKIPILAILVHLCLWAWSHGSELQTFERCQLVETSWADGDSFRVQLDGPVNLNTADIEELAALPGIGPVLAKRIVEARPYREAEDLFKVSGIGKKTLAQISDQIVF